MKDEIKEILSFKENADYKKLSIDEIVILENYIINLQEKYERMKENAEILSNGYNELEKRNEKANWWLKEMLKQAKSDETKAIINGTLELLLNGDDEE